MMKKILLLSTITILMLLVACNNETADVKEDVYDTQNNVSVENNEDNNQQAISNTEGLSQIEIVKLLEEKIYLVNKLKIPYDEYREVYLKYFKSDKGIDDTFLYSVVIYPDVEPLTMKDFIGKDIAETKEYWEEYLKHPLEDYEKHLDEEDEFMNIIEISEVYDDYSKKEWTHVYVQKTVQNKNYLYYGRTKYIFEKVRDEYKITHRNTGWDLAISKEDVIEFTKDKFTSYLQSKRLFKDKNYIEVIDLKALVGKTSEEESWGYLFDK